MKGNKVNQISIILVLLTLIVAVVTITSCSSYMPPAQSTKANYTGRTDAGDAFFPYSAPVGGGESGGAVQ
jgi:hypothetical protein